MTKKKSTKRALISSLLILAMCFTMLAGTTFAWFTDSVTSTGNKIVAGKLDIDLFMATSATDFVEISDSSSPIFGEGSIAQNNNAETLWEPGKTQVAYLKLVNNGNLNLKYKVAITVGGNVKDLYKVMTYAIVPNATYGTVTAMPANAQSVVLGTQETAVDVAMTPGAEHYFALAVHMDEQAGNEYQEGEVTFDMIVLATQLNVEEDSFGPNYDEFAEYPAQKRVATLDEFKDAIADPEITNIVLDAPVTLTEKQEITDNKVIDLNNQTFEGRIDVMDGSTVELTGTGTIGKAGEQSINLRGADSNLVIGEDVTVTGQYGVCIFPEDNTNRTGTHVVDVYGKIEGDIFVSGNLEHGDSVINVYGEIDASATPDKKAALALNGNATVNVYDGAIIKGKTGIEVRAGNLNVYGGTITGIAVPSSATANMSGTTTVGAGIAVSSYGISPIDVEIKGGSISGYSPLYIVNPNNVASYADVKVNVTGGTFTVINDGTTGKFYKADNVPADIVYTNALA